MISSDGVHSFPDVLMAIKRSPVGLIHDSFNLQFITEPLVAPIMGGSPVRYRVLFLFYFQPKLITVIVIVLVELVSGR